MRIIEVSVILKAHLNLNNELWTISRKKSPSGIEWSLCKNEWNWSGYDALDSYTGLDDQLFIALSLATKLFFNSSQQLARFNELLDLFPPIGRNWLLKYLTVRFEFVCLNTNSSNVGNVVPPKLLFAQLTASWEKYQNSQLPTLN